MKIAILGAGAIGGLLAANLTRAGHPVTIIDQGQHLDAIKTSGIKIIKPDSQSFVAAPQKAVCNCKKAGQHDLVFLTLKANILEEIADSIPLLFHEDTMVITLQNGLPWWYFSKHGGKYDGYQFKTLDTSHKLASAINPNRIIGSVPFPSAEVIYPGVIKHIEGNRFPLGELDGSSSPRVKKISQLLEQAQFKAPVLSDIRSHIWIKILGNASFNPISALTHATLEELCREPLTRKLTEEVMLEVKQIGELLGIRFRVSINQRIQGGERTGNHKTSTLQDIENGRRPEIAALIGSIIELGTLVGLNTPRLHALLALLSLLDMVLEDRSAKVILSKI